MSYHYLKKDEIKSIEKAVRINEYLTDKSEPSNEKVNYKLRRYEYIVDTIEESRVEANRDYIEGIFYSVVFPSGRYSLENKNLANVVEDKAFIILGGGFNSTKKKNRFYFPLKNPSR